MNGALVGCMLLAAAAFDHDPATLVGIQAVEAGEVGQVSRPNNNGTVDIGPMGVNEIWVPQVRLWVGLESDAEAFRLLRDDGCANIFVAARILKMATEAAGTVEGGVAQYHTGSGPKRNVQRGQVYVAEVAKRLRTLAVTESRRAVGKGDGPKKAR